VILLSLSGWKSAAVGEVFGVREDTARLAPDVHARRLGRQRARSCRQDAEAVERSGLRLQLMKQQAAARQSG
jgi:hypothetical protein